MTTFEKTIWWTVGILATLPAFIIISLLVWFVDKTKEYIKMHREIGEN